MAGLQIPSLLAPSAKLNGSQAFALPAVGDTTTSARQPGATDNGAPQWYEVLLDTANMSHADILLAPSLITLRTSMAAGPGPQGSDARLLALAHPPSDGTTIIYMGRESVMRLGSPGTAVRQAGQEQTLSWSLDILGPADAPPYSPFTLHLGRNNSALAENAAKLARQYNLFFGWIYGNNPGGCAAGREETLTPGVGRAHAALAPRLPQPRRPACTRWAISRSSPACMAGARTTWPTRPLRSSCGSFRRLRLSIARALWFVVVHWARRGAA